ncbi:Radical SAM domain protein [Methanococcus maripaludis C5]|uniref:Radical SAM domain protein n=1 Tax=Methanococcus maripaludis (strain C5 / ATCC BAA-1333) TaxID=402880 RepID=A4G0I0_METM5|nr:radical SAM protein [Methanococcus maripaludis]ABO35964.1 Radical SAM domain protein [Methanococcus maripaludis C5]
MNSAEILENSINAFKLTEKHHGNITSLERALFLGWYCNLENPCKFCFMSTQKEKIKDPLKARRKPESILAESIIMKRIGWKLEFISGGYGYTTEDLNDTIEMVSYVQQAKQYLNVGIIDFEKLNLNNVEGVVGAVETVNPKLHEEVCPGKPLSNTKEMLKKAKDMGLKTGITIILGMGETENDIELLLNLIEELNLDRITFYSLNPQNETIFEGKTSVTTLDYMNWVSSVRLNFPKIKIISGTWVDKLTNIGPLVMAGSNVITKFPLFSIYGKKEGKTVENEIKSTGRELYSSFSDLELLNGVKKLEKTRYVSEKIDISEKNLEMLNSLSNQIDKKIESYVKTTIRRSQK